MSKWEITENIAVIIAFTILAITFKHWWIFLFSAIFFNYSKNN